MNYGGSSAFLRRDRAVYLSKYIKIKEMVRKGDYDLAGLSL